MPKYFRIEFYKKKAFSRIMITAWKRWLSWFINIALYKGKKKNLTRNNLIDYFVKERCELTNKVIDKALE